MDTYIRTLPICGCGVVHFEEELNQSLICDRLRIKQNLQSFRIFNQSQLPNPK